MTARLHPRSCLCGLLAVVILCIAGSLLRNYTSETSTIHLKSFSRRLFDSKKPPNSDGVTLVTAYFRLPRFQKGAGKNFRTDETYTSWATAFARINNPLVVYTNSDAFYDLMVTIRKPLAHCTQIKKVNITSFWAFQRQKIITEIYNQPGYPKHHPNTVVPAYTCTTHSKVEIVARVAKENVFHTNHFAWFDVGYFRDRVNNNISFKLEIPPDFNKSRIAMTEVYHVNMKTKPEEIFRNKHDWVAGGFSLGHRELLPRYEQQYKRAFDYYLTQNLMNSEQQLLFAMFSDAGRKVLKPEIELQLYHGFWFHLGNLMLKENKLSSL